MEGKSRPGVIWSALAWSFAFSQFFLQGTSLPSINPVRLTAVFSRQRPRQGPRQGHRFHLFSFFLLFSISKFFLILILEEFLLPNCIRTLFVHIFTRGSGSKTWSLYSRTVPVFFPAVVPLEGLLAFLHAKTT